MNVKNLRDTLTYFLELDPSIANLQVEVEPKKVWRFYHLYSGFSRRSQFGKKDVFVWRNPK